MMVPNRKYVIIVLSVSAFGLGIAGSIIAVNDLSGSFVLPSDAQQQSSSENNSVDAKLDIPFNLKYNQQAIIESTNMLAVKFANVTNDSRCPLNAFCIVAGGVTVSIDLALSSTRNDSGNNNRINAASRQLAIDLTVGGLTSNQSSSKEFDGHVIQIIKVEPYPLIGIKTNLKDYNVTLIVSKVQKQEGTETWVKLNEE